MSYCLLIPHYNHVREFERFLPRLVALKVPLLVVDDGSEPAQKAQLRALLEPVEAAILVEYETNRGKGGAIKAGLRAAADNGFSHAFQVDADGQHTTEDVHRFIEASRAEPETIICGRPVFDKSAPTARRYGHRFNDFWVVLSSCSFAIKDSLCGFRVYPVQSMLALCEQHRIGDGMEVDTEILIRAVWNEIEIKFLDTRVNYIPGGASHFNYLRDNTRLVSLHTRLLLGNVSRLPKLARRVLRNRRTAGLSSTP